MADSRDKKGIETPRASRRGAEGERVDINLGHACNHRCIFCMQSDSGSDQRRFVALETLKQELSYYAEEKGLRSLGLLGGEPTLYPNLEQALDHARACGYDDITINTNGFRLADWNFASLLAEKGVNRYCISLHSEDPAIEDYLSGHKGALIRKMRAIRNLIRLRRIGTVEAVISLNAVLNRKNLPSMDRYILFFRGLGITDIRLNYIRPEGGAKDNRELVPSYAESMAAIMELVERNEGEFGIRLSLGEIPPCVFPQTFFSDDTLRERYIGEYSDRRTFVTSFANRPGPMCDEGGRQRFIWQDLKMDELKTLTEACKSCTFLESCGGVWTNYLEMYGDSEFSPLNPYDGQTG